MNKPKLRFSKWYKWEDRKKFPDKNYPGIYMISITNKDLEGKEPEYNDVVYIGMTNSQKGLYGRWSQFQTAIYGKGGHSGGNSVHKQLGYYNTWKKKLFVCGMSVKCNVYKGERSPSDLIKMGWVAFLEYEALAEYKERIGKEPEFHKK